MRSRPLLRFSILSATCLALLGVILSHALAGAIRHRALLDAQETAVLLADEVIRPQLRPEDLSGGPIDPARRARLAGVVADVKGDGRLARVKIWSRRGEIVYSDDGEAIGRRFPISDDLGSALQGRRRVELSDGDGVDQRGERGMGKLVEVYVPLRFGGSSEVAGAFEVYAPYAPVAAAIAHDRRVLIALVSGGLVVLWLLLFRIVAGVSRALRLQVARSRHDADHDLLTGLPNRRALHERLDAAIARSRRDGSSCALLIIDLDGFKELNDTLGHPVGDQLLRELGPRLSGALGPGELLVRLGGDEFAVVLGDGMRSDAPARAAAALQDALEEPFALDGLQVGIGASIGFARHPEHGQDASALMQRADVAMYQAKRARTGTEEYDLEGDGHSRERLALADELRRGIARGELEVHYQPKCDAVHGRVVGVEALVRWRHPVRGILAPGEFVALAQQAGLMRQLTRQVLELALAQLAEWTEAGLELTMAVNLSVPDLLDARLPEDVAGLLARSGVEPRHLTLEITEDVMMTDPQRCAEVLRRLAGLGVRLSLDDFGTGYSSLTHLKSLAVDELKIDRSFVSPMLASGRDAAIVRSMIELAHALGLSVVAEGVEDGETSERLAAFGCDATQGYFLSRPAPAEALTPWLLATERGARQVA